MLGVSRPPVNPSAFGPARELLAYLYSVYGSYTLSGQHNQMHRMSDSSDEIQRITGRYPKICGGEWGFSDTRHDIDNIAYRPALLDEIRKHHAAGRIIVMTYHQANPRVGEPCGFMDGVQGELTAAEWEALFTGGSDFRLAWEAHVDRLAEAFKTLQREGIPIIFRPYHEMNGRWFWWGGDADPFKRLWDLIYDRYTHHHGLNNLLWAWNPDKPYPGVEDFYPSSHTVDLVGTDIYPNIEREVTYPVEWYERMLAIADGRPLALSENSELPTDLANMPWAYWMGWGELTLKANSEEAIRAVFADPRVINSD